MIFDVYGMLSRKVAYLIHTPCYFSITNCSIFIKFLVMLNIFRELFITYLKKKRHVKQFFWDICWATSGGLSASQNKASYPWSPDIGCYVWTNWGTHPIEETYYMIQKGEILTIYTTFQFLVNKTSKSSNSIKLVPKSAWNSQP